MKPVEEVEMYVWLAWNEKDDMWGIIAAGPNPNQIMSATATKEKNARQMRSGVAHIARQAGVPVRLVKFRFAEELEAITPPVRVPATPAPC